MWLTGLAAPRHVGSSQTRARTRVPCIGRQTLNHCATREAPMQFYIMEEDDLHPELCTANSNIIDLRQMLILTNALVLIEKENKCNNNHLK